MASIFPRHFQHSLISRWLLIAGLSSLLVTPAAHAVLADDFSQCVANIKTKAINAGVAMAGCLQNSGEGGISPHHRQGGELIWQIGTGYFGCRDVDGNFNLDKLLETVADAPVRADNVIVLHVRNRRDTASTSKISIVSETVGKGKAEVYRDGRKLDGSWSRRNAQGRLDLKSADRTMPLKPGKTWILLQGS